MVVGCAGPHHQGSGFRVLSWCTTNVPRKDADCCSSMHKQPPDSLGKLLRAMLPGRTVRSLTAGCGHVLRGVASRLATKHFMAHPRAPALLMWCAMKCKQPTTQPCTVTSLYGSPHPEAAPTGASDAARQSGGLVKARVPPQVALYGLQHSACAHQPRCPRCEWCLCCVQLPSVQGLQAEQLAAGWRRTLVMQPCKMGVLGC